jgi:hypothetical protein
VRLRDQPLARARSERGQASPEWLGLVCVVAVALGALLSLAGALPVGAVLARTIGSKIICAADLSDSCRSEPELVAAFGEELAAELRDHAPSVFYERGSRALPVDYRRCRVAACADVAGDGGVSRSSEGVPAAAFVHVVDCRDGTAAPFAGLNSPADCRGNRSGNLYLQYWFYYPESATLRGVPVAGPKGYHRDDWESYQVRIGGGGGASARASSHHGYNYAGGVRNWGSDLGSGPLRGATELAGLRSAGGWGPETGDLFVSGGSHAGNVNSSHCCRVTPHGGLELIPLDPAAAAEQGHPSFAISPPWDKDVWIDPESEGTG